MQSNKTIMLTKHFELTNEFVGIMDIDTKNLHVYDDRLNMAMPKSSLTDVQTVCEEYLKSFCELINRDINCRPSMYTNCGFVPVCVEPVVFFGQFEGVFAQRLRQKGLPFFTMKATSPVSAGFEYRNMKSAHDLWVSKMDAAKFLGVKPHEVTAINLYKEVLA